MAWVLQSAYQIEIQSQLKVVDNRNVQLNSLLSRLNQQE